MRDRTKSAGNPYSLVLMLIVASYTLAILAGSHPWGRLLSVVLLGTTMLTALRASGARTRSIQIATLLFAAALATGFADALLAQGITTRGNSGLQEMLAILLLAGTPVAILRDIGRQDRVTLNSVMGGLAVYIIIGMFFGYLYAGLDRFTGAPMFSPAGEMGIGDHLFFSFITMATVGYGDIVPTSDLGRSLAVTEALMGQAYLVVIVARLVALWKVSPASTPPPTD